MAEKREKLNEIRFVIPGEQAGAVRLGGEH
jgi:hypothetical protein